MDNNIDYYELFDDYVNYALFIYGDQNVVCQYIKRYLDGDTTAIVNHGPVPTINFGQLFDAYMTPDYVKMIINTNSTENMDKSVYEVIFQYVVNKAKEFNPKEYLIRCALTTTYLKYKDINEQQLTQAIDWALDKEHEKDPYAAITNADTYQFRNRMNHLVHPLEFRTIICHILGNNIAISKESKDNITIGKKAAEVIIDNYNNKTYLNKQPSLRR